MSKVTFGENLNDSMVNLAENMYNEKLLKEQYQVYGKLDECSQILLSKNACIFLERDLETLEKEIKFRVSLDSFNYQVKKVHNGLFEPEYILFNDSEIYFIYSDGRISKKYNIDFKTFENLSKEEKLSVEGVNWCGFPFVIYGKEFAIRVEKEVIDITLYREHHPDRVISFNGSKEFREVKTDKFATTKTGFTVFDPETKKRSKTIYTKGNRKFARVVKMGNEDAFLFFTTKYLYVSFDREDHRPLELPIPITSDTEVSIKTFGSPNAFTLITIKKGKNEKAHVCISFSTGVGISRLKIDGFESKLFISGAYYALAVD